jgi:hypothetical protein
MPKTERKTFRTVIRAGSQLASALVEDSLVLSINQVVGHSPRPQASIGFKLTWPPSFHFQGPVTGKVDLSDPTKASVYLEYQLDGVFVNYRVQLVTTAQPFRWWFVCPLENIRVAKLYLPTGARRFASRKAYGLIYRCQAQKRRPGHLRQIRSG